MYSAFTAICNLLSCNCDQFKRHIEHANKIKLFQFFMGLNENHHNVRSNFPMCIPLQLLMKRILSWSNKSSKVALWDFQPVAVIWTIFQVTLIPLCKVAAVIDVETIQMIEESGLVNNARERDVLSTFAGYFILSLEIRRGLVRMLLGKLTHKLDSPHNIMKVNNSKVNLLNANC